MTRKIGLDVVRATAISLVLLSHFVKKLDFLGIYGVEMFFSLSGFLIGGILYRSLTTAPSWSFNEVKVFWQRRWWRTLPNYYFFFLLWIPFHYFFGGLPDLSGLLSTFVFSQNLLSVSSGFFGVAWSLCIEEWFYLLFPSLLLLFTFLRFSKRAAFIAATALFLIIPPILREFSFLHNKPEIVRMMTLPRLDALFYGVAMAFIMARHRLSNPVKVMLLTLSVIGVGSLFVFWQHGEISQNMVPFYRAAFFVLPVCFALILPFFASVKTLPSPLSVLSRPITNLSLWSYSIYLSHIPILFVTYAAFGPSRDSAAINSLSKIVGLAVCLVCSKLIFTYLETPLMHRRPVERSAANAS